MESPLLGRRENPRTFALFRNPFFATSRMKTFPCDSKIGHTPQINISTDNFHTILSPSCNFVAHRICQEEKRKMMPFWKNYHF